MSVAAVTSSSLIVGGQVDLVSVLRHALERHAFDGAVIDSVADIADSPRVAYFFEVDSFMENDPQRLRELVVTLLGAAHAAGMEIAVWLHGEVDGVRFRYAVVDDDSQSASHLGPDFQRMIAGVFPGISLRSMPLGTGERVNRDLLGLQERPAAGVVVGLPSERPDTPVETRLDDVLNGLAGREFDVIVHAQPASACDVNVAEDNLAHLAGVAHQLTKEQISLSESDSFSESVAEGVSTSWSNSETTSWSTSESKATSKQVKGQHAKGIGAAAGALLGGVIGAVVGAPTGPGAAAIAAGGIQIGAAVGGFIGGAMGPAIVPPVQESVTSSSGEGGGTTRQEGGGESATATIGVARQWGKSVGVERLNRQAGLIEDIAEQHLLRARRMKSFGAWHVSVHLAAERSSDLLLVASLLIGALRGDDTHLDPLKLLGVNPRAARALLRRAGAFQEASYAGVPHPLIPRGEQPSTLMSSEELAHWFRPPASPVIGVNVRPHVSFGAATARIPPGEGAVRLGPLLAGGRTVPGAPVAFPTDQLMRHCFIAGTTGAGKTTTMRSILLQLAEQGVPFLVVEPAKSEYRALFDELVRQGRNPLRLSLRGGEGANDRPLQLNPWQVPVGAVVGPHVEGMKILLRSCFSMQESLPQILERAIFDLYAQHGWGDLSEIVPATDSRRFPTFADFVVASDSGEQPFLSKTVRSLGYESQVQKNLTAAITVRLQSFTRGIKGTLFRDEGTLFDELLQRPTFIELSELNEPDIKRFLLGTIVMRLATELAVRHGRTSQDKLKHVLVLEEAHHFLRDAVGHGPSAELARESNLLLADAFAEMRAYGEGIIVADQAPAELSPAVLRNTNLKIAHRLMYARDCEAMGQAMGLDEDQQNQLRLLKVGECVVHGPSFDRPVQCRVDKPE